MTAAALQQLLAELDAAPAGCLDDVRRWVRTLAMEMMQMQAPASGQLYDATATLVAERDRAEKAREEFCTMWNTAIRQRDEALDANVYVCRERDAARAELANVRTVVEHETVERIANMRGVLEKAQTAIYDAMHAGHLSREYADSVVVDIERALKEPQS